MTDLQAPETLARPLATRVAGLPEAAVMPAGAPISDAVIAAAVAAVIPPRRVPLQKRLFWSTVLLLLRFPRGRAWLASRQRRQLHP